MRKRFVLTILTILALMLSVSTANDFSFIHPFYLTFNGGMLKPSSNDARVSKSTNILPVLGIGVDMFMDKAHQNGISFNYSGNSTFNHAYDITILHSNVLIDTVPTHASDTLQVWTLAFLNRTRFDSVFAFRFKAGLSWIGYRNKISASAAGIVYDTTLASMQDYQMGIVFGVGIERMFLHEVLCLSFDYAYNYTPTDKTNILTNRVGHLFNLTLHIRLPGIPSRMIIPADDAEAEKIKADDN